MSSNPQKAPPRKANPDKPHAFKKRLITQSRLPENFGLFWPMEMGGTCDVCGGSELSRVHLS